MVIEKTHRTTSMKTTPIAPHLYEKNRLGGILIGFLCFQKCSMPPKEWKYCKVGRQETKNVKEKSPPWLKKTRNWGASSIGNALKIGTKRPPIRTICLKWGSFIAFESAWIGRIAIFFSKNMFRLQDFGTRSRAFGLFFLAAAPHGYVQEPRRAAEGFPAVAAAAVWCSAAPRKIYFAVLFCLRRFCSACCLRGFYGVCYFACLLFCADPV